MFAHFPILIVFVFISRLKFKMPQQIRPLRSRHAKRWLCVCVSVSQAQENPLKTLIGLIVHMLHTEQQLSKNIILTMQNVNCISNHYKNVKNIHCK